MDNPDTEKELQITIRASVLELRRYIQQYVFENPKNIEDISDTFKLTCINIKKPPYVISPYTLANAIMGQECKQGDILKSGNIYFITKQGEARCKEYKLTIDEIVDNGRRCVDTLYDCFYRLVKLRGAEGASQYDVSKSWKMWFDETLITENEKGAANHSWSVSNILHNLVIIGKLSHRTINTATRYYEAGKEPVYQPIPGYIYAISSPWLHDENGSPVYKIGRTSVAKFIKKNNSADNVAKRLYERYCTPFGRNAVLMKLYYVEDHIKAESLVFECLDNYRLDEKNEFFGMGITTEYIDEVFEAVQDELNGKSLLNIDMPSRQ